MRDQQLKKRIEKTVFISYRRADVYAALAVYQDLTNQNYDVFFDYTSIPSGDFEQIIISNIKARAHFILILTPTALDRCNEPGDWLRREIETAIDEKRNIIPLFFKGFNFGTPSVSEKLTGKLKNIRRYNGFNVHEDFFHAAMELLRGERFLGKPTETVLHPIVSKKVRKVVKEEQLAANRALLHSVKGNQVTEKIPKPAPERERSRKKKTEDESFRRQPKNDAPKTEKKPDTQPSPILETPKPASAATPPNKITLSNGMELVRIAAGKFLMGSKKNNKLAFVNENPQHNVYIPYDYWMARFPVTNELYNTYVKSKGIKHPVSGWEKKKDHPVTYVMWTDAMHFCKWLNSLLKNELPSGLILRLPSEAEWEKAARGTDGREYPWGSTFDKTKCNSGEGGKGGTTPVGSYSPQGDSPFECADMAGNVWEWTHSLMRAYPYKVTDEREDQSAYVYRGVLRGGSFVSSVRQTRCAYRNGYGFDLFDYTFGFRVVAAPKLP